MSVKVSTRAFFDASVEDCFKVYWKLENWLIALDDILSVDVSYDDGEHQTFSMTVSRSTGEETVRGVRYGFWAKRLEVCQFTPPPGFCSMFGVWSFTSISNNRTCVNTERIFELIDHSKEEYTKENMVFLLNRNLSAFRKLVEKGHV
ncbi:hypothetical protein PT277_10400 [Acetobacteraceae bacterium ESL0709]|nr:hypothetical protein [Acetobacteraceae bacterium ESL0697]MDF7679084.1 hypothetical protein [Acetobacteraceae bacterium ESL0709]